MYPTMSTNIGGGSGLSSMAATMTTATTATATDGEENEPGVTSLTRSLKSRTLAEDHAAHFVGPRHSPEAATNLALASKRSLTGFSASHGVTPKMTMDWDPSAAIQEEGEEDQFRDALDTDFYGEDLVPATSSMFQSTLTFHTPDSVDLSPTMRTEDSLALTDNKSSTGDDALGESKKPASSVFAGTTSGVIERCISSTLTLDQSQIEMAATGIVAGAPFPAPDSSRSVRGVARMINTIHDEDDEETTSSSTGVSTGGSTGQNTSSGFWGWFEEIGNNDPFPRAKRDDDVYSSEEGSERGGYTGRGKSKKSGKSKKTKGLMLFDMPSPSEPLSLEPPKAEPTSIPVTAPTYVLEESRSSQELWKETAGNRPPQPAEERAFYERMWAQNFSRSQVTYTMPVEVLTATSPIALSPFTDDQYGDLEPQVPPNGEEMGITATSTDSQGDSSTESATMNRISGTAGASGYYGSNLRGLNSLGPHQHHHTLVNRKVRGPDGQDDLTVVVRGDNVFGTTVSKSFARPGDRFRADTVSVSIASYRVVESKKQGKYAQYLVIYCEGSFRETVGVWKRYSDFDKLAKKVMNAHESCASILAGMHPLSVADDQQEVELLPNAIASWKLLKKRQRWFRCLDAGYLSLKVFLLERFLHDILFESSSPKLLRDFIGVSPKTT